MIEVIASVAIIGILMVGLLLGGTVFAGGVAAVLSPITSIQYMLGMQYMAIYEAEPEDLEKRTLKIAIIILIVFVITLFVHPITKTMGMVFLASTLSAAFIPLTNLFPNATMTHILITTAVGTIVGLIAGIALSINRESTLCQMLSIDDNPVVSVIASVLGAIQTTLTVNCLYIFLRTLSIFSEEALTIADLDVIKKIVSSANIYSIIAGVIFLIASIIISLKRSI